MDILEFTGEHRFLSNFWPAEVELDDHAYPTVEHAFQAAKCVRTDDAARVMVGEVAMAYRKAILTCPTPAAAKAMGRQAILRPDWQDVKIPIMTHLVRQKFHRHPQLAALLIATAPGKIVEGNNWNDYFWGQCGGKGQNHLGRILKQVRSDLMATEQPVGEDALWIIKQQSVLLMEAFGLPAVLMIGLATQSQVNKGHRFNNYRIHVLRLGKWRHFGGYCTDEGDFHPWTGWSPPDGTWNDINILPDTVNRITKVIASASAIGMAPAFVKAERDTDTFRVLLQWAIDYKQTTEEGNA